MISDNYILCVDDDEDDCKLLDEAIKKNKQPSSVKYVRSGEEAITFLTASVKQGNYPRLIVLDINMPKMNGFQLLLEIRKILPVFVPILFLTSSSQDKDIIYSENHQASFMTKPTDLKGYQAIADTIFMSLIQ